MVDFRLHTDRVRLAVYLATMVIAICHLGCRPREADKTASANPDGRSLSGTTLERATTPDEAGMSTDGLSSVLDVVQGHIEDKTTPGAVVLIARRGKIVLEEALGHTGFTGVSLWIDPERELVAILLTNRIHPTRENQQIYELRPDFHRAVNAAVIGPDGPSEVNTR